MIIIKIALIVLSIYKTSYCEATNISIRSSYGISKIKKFEYGTKLLKIKHPKKTGFLDIGVGYHFGDKITAEIQYNYLHQIHYTSNHYTKNTEGYTSVRKWYTTQKTNSIFLGIIYNIIDYPSIFLGSGIGISHNQSGDMKTYRKTYSGMIKKSKTIIENKNKSNLQPAWYIGIGIDKKIDNKINLSMYYKYVNLGEVKTMEDENGDILINMIKFSVIGTSIKLKL